MASQLTALLRNSDPLTTATHAVLFLTAASLAFATFNNTLFAWHPFAMSLGFLFFMPEGILAGVAFRALDGVERVRAIEGHALMQLRGLVLILVGAGAIVYNKVLHGKHHFVSLHAKVSVFLELAFFCRR